ncbi:MAG: hypothetical protein H0W69_00005, partial [Gemmatimonadaceae bacterium]|nr:hypothetical protein [Gemmatimonadaceae bacterium]
MPVTAKLSRKFYERFGDEITGELVDWFNAVDTTYQTQLRELNDLNWERFKAELHAAKAELRGEMNAGFAEMRLEMERFRSSMMKWMFVYWTGMMA